MSDIRRFAMDVLELYRRHAMADERPGPAGVYEAAKNLLRYEDDILNSRRCVELAEIERVIDALETRLEEAEKEGQLEAASAFQHAIDLLKAVG